MAFKLSIIEDFSSIFRGTKRLGDAYDDVADALDNVAREGKTAGDKLERSFSEAFQEVRRDSKRMADDVADDTRRSVQGRGGDAIGEFRDEARQNFSEVASSFSGGIDGAADLVQGTLGGLAGSLPGPVGLISGLLAGIGGAWFASMDDNAGKSERRVQEAFDNMLESGLNYLSDEAVSEGIAAIYQGSEDAAISLEKAQKYAELLGLDVGTVAAAFAGSERAQNDWNDAIARGRGEVDRLLETGGLTAVTEDGTQSAIEYGNAIVAAEEAMAGVSGSLDEARDRVQGARDAQEQWTEAGRRSAAEAERQAEATRLVTERYRSLEGKTFYPTVVARADTSALDRELARPRTIKVGVAVRPGTQVVI